MPTEEFDPTMPGYDELPENDALDAFAMIAGAILFVAMLIGSCHA